MNKSKSEVLRINVEPFGEILNERPKGMDYETYRKKRREQCLKLRGFNIYNPATARKQHVMGRLEGVLISSIQWTNSRNAKIVIG